MNDDYEQKLAAWKARVGFQETEYLPDEEALMVAEDAELDGNAYCIHCGEQFAISDMRLITRTDDPYIQDEEYIPSDESELYYIPVEYRVRACKPCFKREYEEGEGDE